MKKLLSIVTTTAFSLSMMTPIVATAQANEIYPLSTEAWQAQQKEGLVYSVRDVTISSTGDAVELNKILDKLSALKDATVVVRYTNTNDGIGSLFSVSDSTKVDKHFHLYQDGTTLGFEFRNSDNPKYTATTSVYDKEPNTVAFVADSNYGYKLFANGVLGAQIEKKDSEYQFLKDIENLDKAYLGKTERQNDANSYPFTGTIESIEVYSNALPDKELIERTASTQKQRTKVFYNGDETGSKFFRIPFLLNTVDGSLIAGCDANFGSTGDSAENIDATIRRKADAVQHKEGEGWSDAQVPYALHMQDYADETGYKQFSSSVIDGVIVQDQKSDTNRILLLIDAFAWNGGVFQYLNIDDKGEAHGGTPRNIAYGDGFCTIGDKKYLLLSSENIKEKGINMNIDRTKFNYAVDLYGEKNSDGRYNIYKLVGTPKPYSGNGTNVDDSNLSLGEISEYSLSSEYELYKNGELMHVTQKTSDTDAKPHQVPSKIFYEDCELQMYNTSYLLQVYSDDDGATWQSGNIISGMVKREDSRYYITGPGSGLQIKNGKYAGRILIPMYYQYNGKSCTEVIYTDDGGTTWQHGNRIPSNLGLHESAIVEMPDGSLQIFVRNTAGSGGMIITATSDDGGENWTDGTSLFGDNKAGTNCQISAINYSAEVKSAKDGKSYPAVLLATTSSKARTNGHIYVGLIKPDNADGYTIDWEYDYVLTGNNELFAYSSMAELSDGRIGILYETSENNSWSTGLQQMYYKELTIGELTKNPMS